jgi:hypothetical protein
MSPSISEGETTASYAKVVKRTTSVPPPPPIGIKKETAGPATNKDRRRASAPKGEQRCPSRFSSSSNRRATAA